MASLSGCLCPRLHAKVHCASYCLWKGDWWSIDDANILIKWNFLQVVAYIFSGGFLIKKFISQFFFFLFQVASPMSKVRQGWYAEHGIEKRGIYTFLITSIITINDVLVTPLSSSLSSLSSLSGIYPFTTTTPAPTTEPFLTITVVWEISFIDYPICLDRSHSQERYLRASTSSLPVWFRPLHPSAAKTMWPMLP